MTIEEFYNVLKANNIPCTAELQYYDSEWEVCNDPRNIVYNSNTNTVKLDGEFYTTPTGEQLSGDKIIYNKYNKKEVT